MCRNPELGFRRVATWNKRGRGSGAGKSGAANLLAALLVFPTGTRQRRHDALYYHDLDSPSLRLHHPSALLIRICWIHEQRNWDKDWGKWKKQRIEQVLRYDVLCCVLWKAFAGSKNWSDAIIYKCNMLL